MAELPSINKKATGHNLKRLMRKNRLTTFDLQRKLNLTSPATLYVWFRGEYLPNADSLVKLAYLFNCKVDDLLVTVKEVDEYE